MCRMQSTACNQRCHFFPFSFRLAKHDRHNALAILSFVIPLTASIIYCVHNNPLVFQILFGILTTLAMYIIHERVQKSKQARPLVSRSFLLLLIAFAIWNVDNLWCHHVRSARALLRFPLDGYCNCMGGGTS